MKYLTSSIRALCESIIEKNQKYKTKRERFSEKAKKSLVDNFETVAFLDSDKNIIITLERGDIELEEFNEIDPAATKVLDRKRHLITDNWCFHVALMKDDIYISHAQHDLKPNPIGTELSESEWDTASGVYIKEDNGFVARCRPHGKWDDRYYLTLATEEELKKVISVLNDML